MINGIFSIIGVLVLLYFVSGAIEEIKEKGLRGAINDTLEDLLVFVIIIALLILIKIGIQFLLGYLMTVY